MGVHPGHYVLKKWSFPVITEKQVMRSKSQVMNPCLMKSHRWTCTFFWSQGVAWISLKYGCWTKNRWIWNPPKWMVKIMETLLKMGWFGVFPYFFKHPYTVCLNISLAVLFLLHEPWGGSCSSLHACGDCVLAWGLIEIAFQWVKGVVWIGVPRVPDFRAVRFERWTG